MPFFYLNLKPVQSSLFTLFILLTSLVSSSLLLSGAQPVRFTAPSPILLEADRLLKTGRGNHAKAVYEAYLKSHPQEVTAFLGLAQIAQRYTDYPQARVYLENALTTDPENVEVIATLARLYHLWSTNPFGPQEKYTDRANEYFVQGEALNLDHPLLIAYRGEWYLDQNDLVSAQRNLQRAIRLNPKCVPAFQGLTRYYLQVKDLPRAKETALHAIELDPDNSRSHFLVAQLLAYAEHPDKAIQYALKSEQLDFGRNPERNLFLAKQFEKLGNTTQALEYYTEVAKDAPQHNQTLLRMAELHEQNGDEKQSKHFYKKAIANDPSILTHMMDNAQQHLRTENTKPACRLFFKTLMLSDDPTIQEDALQGLASAVYLDAYYRQTDSSLLEHVLKALEPQVHKKAQLQLAFLKARIAKAGFVPSGLKNELTLLSQANDPLVSGEALFLLGDYTKANEQLDRLDGETARGYLRLGDRLLILQALIPATAMYQRGFQLSPLPEIKQGLQRIEAKRQLADRRIAEGNNHFNKKEYLEALRPYGDAKKIVPGWETPLLRLADTYEQLKQKASAFYAYQQAIQINPTLLDSKGFTKKYKKLEKKTRKLEAKKAKR